ncbi:MAG: hypothetical protein P8X63_03025 [Desulfuromonadaceae bacterium]
MRNLKLVLATLVALGLAVPALAADFKFSGDLNHRFNLYTNQGNIYSGPETISSANPIEKNDVEEFFGDIKYRLVVEAATNDGRVKGVYAVEVGGLRFGRSGGGGYSGDGTNVETRWAYTDIQLPTDSKTRLLIGLQPFTVNKFLWNETAMGVQFKGDAGPVAYTLAWMRGKEYFNTTDDDDLFEDADAFLARGDLKPAENVKLGLFALYERANPSTTTAPTYNHELKRIENVDYDLYTFGADGGMTAGNLFVNWDLMYQTGEAEDGNGGDFDLEGYFAHADVGVKLGKTTVTYTGWYASGDDDANDNDMENFIATDVDTFDSIVLFEGGYNDDNYFTEAPYILDKGMIFNKIAVDHQATEKLKVGAAVLYLMTAEDLELADGSKEDKLGTELDAYVSYMLYPNVEVALNFGYLFADDAMDYWEGSSDQDGDSDTDIYRSTMRVRYQF